MTNKSYKPNDAELVLEKLVDAVPRNMPTRDFLADGLYAFYDGQNVHFEQPQYGSTRHVELSPQALVFFDRWRSAIPPCARSASSRIA